MEEEKLTKQMNKNRANKQSKVAAADKAVQFQRDGVRVKARRGQATNSHSLAERARREKISMSMKLLQSLVPGCDQITGKARILDEIIKYVQLLQNQVECLTAQLASVDLMLYFCELNQSANPSASERLCCLEPQFSSVLEPSPTQFGSLVDVTPTSASILLTEEQKASLIHQAIWEKKENSEMGNRLD
ncbi:transcription factor bHLH137-like isoform X2 [Pyrus x bretschneideri]|uniref:transcription factor bHLH137-like isoform X2 n=1 Tax=Pyrus x bretschneideri TaxID=225117 RepID=UPI00202F6682|nr:transcription factor bHLH137-like isoform X2 [Pyrus x bretschneideri]